MFHSDLQSLRIQLFVLLSPNQTIANRSENIELTFVCENYVILERFRSINVTFCKINSFYFIDITYPGSLARLSAMKTTFIQCPSNRITRNVPVMAFMQHYLSFWSTNSKIFANLPQNNTFICFIK